MCEAIRVEEESNMFFYQGTEELFSKNKLNNDGEKISFLKQTS